VQRTLLVEFLSLCIELPLHGAVRFGELFSFASQGGLLFAQFGLRRIELGLFCRSLDFPSIPLSFQGPQLLIETRLQRGQFRRLGVEQRHLLVEFGKLFIQLAKLSLKRPFALVKLTFAHRPALALLGHGFELLFERGMGSDKLRLLPLKFRAADSQCGGGFVQFFLAMLELGLLRSLFGLPTLLLVGECFALRFEGSPRGVEHLLLLHVRRIGR